MDKHSKSNKGNCRKSNWKSKKHKKQTRIQSRSEWALQETNGTEIKNRKFKQCDTSATAKGREEQDHEWN